MPGQCGIKAIPCQAWVVWLIPFDVSLYLKHRETALPTVSPIPKARDLLPRTLTPNEGAAAKKGRGCAWPDGFQLLSFQLL